MNKDVIEKQDFGLFNLIAPEIALSTPNLNTYLIDLPLLYI